MNYINYIIYKYNPYHLVLSSPYPMLINVYLLTITINISGLFSNIIINISGLFNNIIINNIFNNYLMTSVLFLILSIVNWTSEISTESNCIGNHTDKVIIGLVTGFLLFIVSEISVFFSLFWAFLHTALSPTIWISGLFPANNIEAISPYDIALVGSLLLVSSSLSISASHLKLVANLYIVSSSLLFITIVLGICFTVLQYIEYKINILTFDNIYGSLFYASTGTHGIHIILGVIMLLISLINNIIYNSTSYNHLGYKLSSIYWHFVDILWAFILIIVYIFI